MKNFFYKKVRAKNYIIKEYYLFGLIRIVTDTISLRRDIRIFGCTVLKSYISKDVEKITLNIPIMFNFNADAKKIKTLYKEIKDVYNEDFDSIYSLSGSPSGELYIILNLLESILKLHQSEKPVLFVDKKFKYNLCKLYHPDIPCILLQDFSIYVYNLPKYKINNCTIYTLFDTMHYIKQDILIRKNIEHFYNYILKDIGIQEKQNFKLPQISVEAKNKIINFVGLYKKFVILSPEANTSNCLSKDFWVKLCKYLFDRDYKIFLNICNMANYIEGCIPIYFSYEEMFELCNNPNCKHFIGIRSGLFDVLSLCKTDMHVIYPDIPDRGILKAINSASNLNGFTLKKLPDTIEENIHEYDLNVYDKEDEIIENIMKNLKNEEF